MTPLLEVRDLRKLYPQRGQGIVALDSVSFSLQAGEALGLVGESGSGKSTLCGLIARLADPTAGSILLDGQEIATLPARRAARAPWRARIQMVFQDPADSLDPRLTALRAVAAPLARLRGLRGAALEHAARQALERARLEPALLQRRPHQLSGGQLARVGIARAIALEPSLLILDEATSALDVSIQVAILRLLEELRRDLGLAYLFVSHDLNVVRLLCRRTLVMQAGRIVDSGETEALFTAPRHPHTAALVAAIPLIGKARRG